MEAEYIALSSSLKTFLPLKWTIEDMIKNLKANKLKSNTVHCEVFEDNQSAYLLATNQRITDRSRYLLAGFHWFWQQYNRGEFKVTKCPTNDMLADPLTKALSRVKFQQHRQTIMGW
jgi:hypothetical protein